MSIETHRDLLEALLKASKPSEIQSILKSVGDKANLGVEEPFGSQGYHWRFYGDNESNMSTINLGSKPERSLIERITNAIDAVLEKEMLKKGGTSPSSPMQAAKEWFGRPPTDIDSGLFCWQTCAAHGHDRHVHVVLTPGDEEAFPTIDVIDEGTGIQPAEFPHTILSLHSGNKIKKRYLAGAFGQGGAATLAFCNYTIIVSRHFQSPQTVGFTVVKLMNLGESYKENAYVYLAVKHQDGTWTVPSCTWNGPIEMYPSIPVNKWLKQFKSGTWVRHCGYEIAGFEKTLGPSPGNLCHLLHYKMFDPIIPFRVVDLRDPSSVEDELVIGARNQLMKLLEKPALAKGETGTELRHYAPREMVNPLSEAEPSVAIEYWVALNIRERKGRIGPRRYSSSLFVDPHHPTIGTLHGQNQGELTSRLIKDLQLSMVARHLVIHIDASRASKNVRTSLFASTREGFKESRAYNELMRVLMNRLQEDRDLYEIERELEEELLYKDTVEVNQEVQQEIASLLRDAGFEVKEPGKVAIRSKNSASTRFPTSPNRKFRDPEPLQTLPYPKVTRFELVFPEEKISVHQQDNHIVRVETDADVCFDQEGRITIHTEPRKLEAASKSQLRNGRMYWRLRPTPESSPGDRGSVIIALTKPDGKQIEARLPYEILPPREEKAKKAKRVVLTFSIESVDPFEHPAKFEQIWPEANQEDVQTVAYRAKELSGRIIVYYSTAFTPYRRKLEEIKDNQGLAEEFRKNYEIWIGYHAILQHQQQLDAGETSMLDLDELERIQEHERTLVAEMLTKQAVKAAEMKREAVKAEYPE
jgi:hypothetical protein